VQQAIPAKDYKNKSAEYRKKYMYMPKTIQTMLTLWKYLTSSSKSYLQNRKGLRVTKKQMEECNKIGFLPPTKKTYYRNLKSERRSDCHDTLPDKQALTL